MRVQNSGVDGIHVLLFLTLFLRLQRTIDRASGKHNQKRSNIPQGVTLEQWTSILKRIFNKLEYYYIFGIKKQFPTNKSNS